MAHPLWTGALVVGALRIPAQILGAGEPDTVAFHQAHRCRAMTLALARIKQKKWCPRCKQDIAAADLVRVYEQTDGQYLEITDTDLASCEAEASDALTVLGLADAPRVPMLHIESTAYLVAHGEAAAEPVATFCAALGPTQIAIARLVLRKRRQLVWLGVGTQGCVVYLLRTRDQIAAVLRGDGPTRGTRHEDVTALRQILTRLPRRIDHVLPSDEYQQRVRAMLEQKTARASRAALSAALRPRHRRRA